MMEYPRRPTVCDILRRYAPEYLETDGHLLADHEERTLTQLTQCRTSALGGHRWKCKVCGGQHVSFNSCHNRHCPGCADKRRDTWLKRMYDWMLPVAYWHLVFTVPHHLNRLIEANQEAIYRLQFDATRCTLNEVAADPRGVLGAVQVGFMMMLHTWGQRMLRHLHTHVVMPAGGFRKDGSGWLSAEGSEFFLDEDQLADSYRDYYLDQLPRLHQSGDLEFPGALAHLADEARFKAFLAPLKTIRWVVHTGSPEHCHRPEAALEYLSRYVVGSVISDARIVSDEEGEVTIRIKDYRHGGERKTISMPGVEFVRRFMMHVLPFRMSRVRYAGFLGGRYRTRNLAQTREELAAEPTPAHSDESVELGDELPEADTDYPCPHCGAHALMWVGEIPGWSGWHPYVSLMPRVAQERIRRELYGAARPPPKSVAAASGSEKAR
jgi:hypothetical protein